MVFANSARPFVSDVTSVLREIAVPHLRKGLTTGATKSTARVEVVADQNEFSSFLRYIKRIVRSECTIALAEIESTAHGAAAEACCIDFQAKSSKCINSLALRVDAREADVNNSRNYICQMPSFR